jgi:hypothetical protein
MIEIAEGCFDTPFFVLKLNLNSIVKICESFFTIFDYFNPA